MFNFQNFHNFQNINTFILSEHLQVTFGCEDGFVGVWDYTTSLYDDFIMHFDSHLYKI
jgi:steroid 5-alpha reductase family enzyme